MKTTTKRIDRNKGLFNPALKSKAIDVRKPPPTPHLVDGRPWWAVAPREGLTRIARERRANR